MSSTCKRGITHSGPFWRAESPGGVGVAERPAAAAAGPDRNPSSPGPQAAALGTAATGLLRLSGVVQDSIVDGPGLRLAVFAQGCPHLCPGCHNPQTHAAGGGQVWRIDDILAKLRSNPLLDGVTLSGGEPFAQAPAMAELARRAKGLGHHVMTYTGYTYERLLAGAEANPGWRELLEETDVLVDGPFVLGRRSLELRFRGSANQRLLDVPASLRQGRPVLWEPPED
ncbi:anaerobic ribonucleoside-triphosphate reductase activating protein [Gorillibacterium sp. sgz5001074]|uniref:anaerobic ribonucleoside-triphosphate reductase activating protein n=1 Tax=Gorillibacterium sp. sgz5001074 TaxID=3446695 RepID=UPI003F661387